MPRWVHLAGVGVGEHVARVPRVASASLAALDLRPLLKLGVPAMSNGMGARSGWLAGSPRSASRASSAASSWGTFTSSVKA